MAATLKKPTAPTAKVPAPPKAAAAKAGAPAKSKPPAKPKAEKPAPPALQVGNVVTFTGYKTERAEGEAIFNAENKPKLAIIGSESDDHGPLYAVVSVDDYWKYTDLKTSGVADDDERMPTGDYLREEDFRRGPLKDGAYPVVPEREAEIDVKLIGDLENLLAAHENDPFKFALKAMGEADLNLFYAGGALALIKHKKLFANYADPDAPKDSEGNDTAYSPDTRGWQKFIADNFPEGFGFQKAESYIRVYDRISVLPNAEEIVAQLPEIGFVKATAMVGHLTESNATDIVSAATQMTSKDFKVHLQQNYTTEDGKNAVGKASTRVSVKMVSLTYKLWEDSAVGVNMVLDAAEKQTGLKDAQLFEHIVMQWGMDHLGKESVEKAAARAAAKRASFTKANVKFPANHPVAIAQAAALEAANKTAAPAATPAKPKLQPASAAKGLIKNAIGKAKTAPVAASA